MNTFYTILGLLLVAGKALSGELADEWEARAKQIGKPLPTEPQHHGRGSAEVSEIAIERGPCFGPCPTYVFTVNSNGNVRFVGEANVTPLGVRTGKVPIGSYWRLAQFIRDSRFVDLSDSYAANVTCLSSVYTRVKIGRRVKLVSNYGDAGPSKLWATENLIDCLMQETTWDDQKTVKE